MKLTMQRFEQAVERAIASIPEEIRAYLRNMTISVENRPSPELMDDMGIPPGETLFGVYTGIPLPERSVTEPPLYPDEILIFKEPLEGFCRDLEELEEEIEITVVHEVAHYLGLSEERLVELGYE